MRVTRVKAYIHIQFKVLWLTKFPFLFVMRIELAKIVLASGETKLIDKSVAKFRHLHSIVHQHIPQKHCPKCGTTNANGVGKTKSIQYSTVGRISIE